MKPKTKPPLRRLYINDNLPVLRCMDSETADLIYLDPPFNSGKNWVDPIGGKKGRAKAAFKDTWTPSDTHEDEAHALVAECPTALDLIYSLHGVNGGSWYAYLIYMAARLVEMRRILKPTGSIYYHCDPTMSHGVKLVMDAVFGGSGAKSGGNFRNEIIWSYPDSPSASVKDFPRKHDVILRYARGKKFVFNKKEISVPYAASSIKRIKYAANKSTVMSGTKIKLREEGKIPPSVWGDIKQAYRYRESTGYPTQKPLALLERIIKASSDEGGVVLDPFCGCGTTLVAAQQLKRQWIGIDISPEAVKILRERVPLFSEKQSRSGVEHFDTGKLPKRTDLPKMTDRKILRARLYKLQGGKCAAPCGEGNEGRKLPQDLLELDHITSRERGGQDIDENMQLLCSTCNRIKGADGMTKAQRRILENKTRAALEAYHQKRDIELAKIRAQKADKTGG